MRRILFVVVCVALLMSSRQVAEASCGLEYCPLPEDTPTETSSAPIGKIQFLLRNVDFSLSEGQGRYQEGLFRFEFHRFSNWNLGTWIAPVRLEVTGETRTGTTNPVLFAERGFRLNAQWSLSAGTQLELPFGDSEDGIASDHTEVLPYLGAAYNQGVVNLQIRTGLAMAVGSDGGHTHMEADAHGSALFVNPHEDREALLRLAASMQLLDGRLEAGLHFNGRRVLEDADEKNFFTGEVASNYRLTKSTNLLAQVDFPISSAQRFDWRAGAGVARNF